MSPLRGCVRGHLCLFFSELGLCLKHCETLECSRKHSPISTGFTRGAMNCATTNQATFEKGYPLKVYLFVVMRFIASLRKLYYRNCPNYSHLLDDNIKNFWLQVLEGSFCLNQSRIFASAIQAAPIVKTFIPLTLSFIRHPVGAVS